MDDNLPNKNEGYSCCFVIQIFIRNSIIFLTFSLIIKDKWIFMGEVMKEVIAGLILV